MFSKCNFNATIGLSINTKGDFAMSEKENEDFYDEEMTVTLDLDDGSSVECAIISIFTAEEQDYIALLPLDENGENEDGEVWLYRYFEDETNPDEDPTLESIEDDEEYEKVAEAFDQFLDDSEFDEIINDALDGES